MTHPHLEGLIRKFREAAKRHEDAAEEPGLSEAQEQWRLGMAQMADECADELEAALAALPGGGVGVTDEMVERAARAIHPGAWATHDGTSKFFRQGTSEKTCRETLGTARLVLTAALSPTPSPHEADQ